MTKAYARIVDGVVTNVEIWGETPPATPGITFVESDTAALGDLWDGDEFTRPAPTAAAPAEVQMHKVQKAALLTSWPGAANLLAAIEEAFTQLPSPSDKLAAIEWNKAPNLVREGLTTQAVMAILGMTAEQRDELLNFAASLP